MGIFGVFKKKVDIPEPPQFEEPLELPPIETPELPEIHLPEIKAPEEFPRLPEIKLPEITAPSRTMSTKPVFVSVQDYETILTSLSSIRDKLASTDNYLKELQHLKQQHEKELESWRSQLEDVERKLSYVDEVLFTGG